MVKKHFLFGLVLASLIFPYLAEAQSSGRVTAAVSQTAVTIIRHPRDNERRTDMEIYIDGRRMEATAGRKTYPVVVKNGEQASVAVNNGVHTIYVKVGRYQSDTINFTADGTSIPFVASVEGGFRGLVQDTVGANAEGSEIQSIRTRVVLSRNVIEEDTGSLINREVQGAY